MRTILLAGSVILACSTLASAQNCVVIGTTNFGMINQNCGPSKLTFQPAIAEELVSKIPPGKLVRLMSVGSNSDQGVANQYQQFLVGRGFNIERSIIGMMAPPPDHPITVNDVGNAVIVTIAPSAL